MGHDHPDSGKTSVRPRGGWAAPEPIIATSITAPGIGWVGSSIAASSDPL
jgi:hypothetical protein